MRTQPDFWTTRSVVSVLLFPLSLLYGLGTWLHRLCTTPKTLSVPVISVGNVTAGGAGKTPVTIALTELLKQRGHTPHIVSRGYGAKIAAPIRVSSAQHKSTDVGDEALLLAKHAPTWVCPNRIASGDAAVASGASLVVCDDALQHHALKKDVSLLVIDGAYGIGNGLTLPAGPLREPFRTAHARCDAIIIIGNDMHGISTKTALPVFRAMIKPVGDVSWLKSTRIVAFAGIARPQKLYDSLLALGAVLTGTFSFADHHKFTEEELRAITATGTAVTTEKDWVRLSPEWQTRIKYLPVELVFDDANSLGNWLEQKLRA